MTLVEQLLADEQDLLRRVAATGRILKPSDLMRFFFTMMMYLEDWSRGDMIDLVDHAIAKLAKEKEDDERHAGG